MKYAILAAINTLRVLLYTYGMKNEFMFHVRRKEMETLYDTLDLLIQISERVKE